MSGVIVPKRPVGRPRLNPETAEAPSAYIGFKSDDELKEQLQAAGARADRSLSAETRHRVELTFAQEDMLGQALLLAHGADNGGLIILIGEVLRALTPRGQWRDNPDQGDAVLRGCTRLLQRLQSPWAAIVVEDENSPEGRVDQLLWDLGDTGDEQPHHRRWATEIRRRIGSLGPLLIEMRAIATIRTGGADAADALDDLIATGATDHLREALASLDPDNPAQLLAAFREISDAIEETAAGRPGGEATATEPSTEKAE
jgi:hypothetical protein